jgi:hypothetical protein
MVHCGSRWAQKYTLAFVMALLCSRSPGCWIISTALLVEATQLMYTVVQRLLRRKAVIISADLPKL